MREGDRGGREWVGVGGGGGVRVRPGKRGSAGFRAPTEGAAVTRCERKREGGKARFPVRRRVRVRQRGVRVRVVVRWRH